MMFYSENDILSELKCPICKDIFDEPKLLECGYAICNQCILSHIETKQTKLTNEFKCLLCSEVHELPKNGFTVCKPLLKLLAKSSNTIYRGEHVESLITNIRYVENELKKLDFELNNGSDVIKDHCIELRRQIQLTTETNIQKIYQLNELMIKQIDEFESATSRSYSTLSKEKLNVELAEFKQICDESNNYLKRFQISDQQVEDLNEKLIDLRTKISFYEQDIKSFIFNGQLLKYKRAETLSSLIGELSVCEFNSIDFGCLERVDMSEWFNRALDLKYLRFRFFDNGCLVIAYGYESSNQLNILIFNEYDKTLKQSRVIENVMKMFQICVSKNRIYMQYKVPCVDEPPSTNCKWYLKVYDENLELINQIQTIKHWLIAVNNSLIFCMSSDESLIVYNHSLQVIKKIGQNEQPASPFYFPVTIYEIIYEHNRYYIHSQENEIEYFRIVDEHTGHLIKLFELEQAKLLKINTSKNNIIMIECNDLLGKESLRLKYLNLNGDLIKEIRLNNFPSSSWMRYFCLNKSNKIHFFNYKQFTVS